MFSTFRSFLGVTAVWLVISQPSFGQSAGTAIDEATKESIRRQASKVDVRAKLAKAQDALKAGKHAEAARLSEEALQLLKGINSGVESELAAATSSLAASRLQLAQQAQRGGNLLEAEKQVDRVLLVDFANKEAQEFKRNLEKVKTQLAGRTPSPEVLASISDITAGQQKLGTQVQDAKILVEAGKLNEAEGKLKSVIASDPGNQGAFYYLNIIREQRHQQELMKREGWAQDRFSEVTRAWMDPNTRASLPQPNPYAQTNMVNTSRARQAIFSKLNRIHVDEIRFESKSLTEVVKELTTETSKRDPDKTGVNLLLAPNLDLPTLAPTLDANGQPIPTAPAADGAPILGDVVVNIPTPLRNLSIFELLDAIVKVADRPIKYSIEDYAIIFSFKSRELESLHTRTFKVDPNTFRQGLESVAGAAFGSEGGSSGSGGSGGGGGGGRSGGGGSGGQGGGQGGQGGQAQEQLGSTFASVRIAGIIAAGAGAGAGAGAAAGGINSNPQVYQGELGAGGSGVTFLTRPAYTQVIGQTVRNFFLAAGVILDPPKTLFYNDRNGLLMVRATLSDLDIIEQAIHVLNVPPPQLSIKARFAEVNLSQNKQLGFDWYLGNTLSSSGKIGAQGGSAPSFQGDPGITSPANPTGVFPGPDPSGLNQIAPSATDNLLTSGLRNNAPALGTLTGILTDPQFRFVVRALEQRGGINVLNAPEVTTVSSRQTQIKAVDVKFVVTSLDLNQTSGGGGGGGTAGGTTGGQGAVGSSIQPIATPIELGPVLDVLPYVSADGYTIQMTIIPTLKEFTGYDLETAQLFQAQAQSVGGVPTATIRQNIPLPNFRLRQVATTAIVWDGQTVVLGGLISDSETKVKDKVPFLGDLPLFGRLFRSESNISSKKNLMIFVTPTIIDPAGNRVHSEEEMPFARSGIPSQNQSAVGATAAAR